MNEADLPSLCPTFCPEVGHARSAVYAGLPNLPSLPYPLLTILKKRELSNYRGFQTIGRAGLAGRRWRR
jgi:hypothetical protein